MAKLSLLIVAGILSFTQAKICTNFTIPVNITARTGVFGNLPAPIDGVAVTGFAQNFTRQGSNYTQEALTGYTTTAGVYNISAKFCRPDNASISSNGTTVQFLTHGIGFDKGYWDLPYNNYNYSYTNVAVDNYGYSTLAIDRLGVGNSSHPDPISVVQSSTELAAIAEITRQLRSGTISALNGTRASKVVHVGHSFGSILSYELAAAYPTLSDGLILTGFSVNGSFLPQTIAAWNLEIANKNQPARFGSVDLASILPLLETYGIADLVAGITIPVGENLPNGYITWANLGANQFTFLAPPYYDPAIGPYTESTKYPVTYGEILTLGSQPLAALGFTGPVQVVTGDYDEIFCGGNCTNTGGRFANIPVAARAAFPNSTVFESYIQPRTGHAINVHYNATGAYNVIQNFLGSNGLRP